jgi:hypothetical protein
MLMSSDGNRQAVFITHEFELAGCARWDGEGKGAVCKGEGERHGVYRWDEREAEASKARVALGYTRRARGKRLIAWVPDDCQAECLQLGESADRLCKGILCALYEYQ